MPAIEVEPPLRAIHHARLETQCVAGHDGARTGRAEGQDESQPSNQARRQRRGAALLRSPTVRSGLPTRSADQDGRRGPERPHPRPPPPSREGRSTRRSAPGSASSRPTSSQLGLPPQEVMCSNQRSTTLRIMSRSGPGNVRKAPRDHRTSRPTRRRGEEYSRSWSPLWACNHLPLAALHLSAGAQPVGDLLKQQHRVELTVLQEASHAGTVRNSLPIGCLA